MNSERKVQTNRKNAALSTGPKTASGKSIARRNAYRHGLAAQSSSSSIICHELARNLLIQGHACDLMQAEIIAEAELHLIRIRKTKADMINAAMSARHGCNSDSGTAASALQAFVTVLPALERIERYERRALSRRRRATRNLYGASI
jgi:hypothetical protein